MENSVQRIPRFSLLSGIGAIVVYLLGSAPYVVVITAIKTIEYNDDPRYTSARQIQKAVTDYLMSDWILVGVLFSQCFALAIYVWAMSWIRGTKNIKNDLGIRFSKKSFLFIFAGAGLQLVAILLSLPLQQYAGRVKEQELVTTVRNSHGVGFFVLMLFVGFIVPFAEEVAFRGAFMRGLNKKVAPFISVIITGSIFSVVHLSDPNVIYGFGGLFLFGIVASAFAMYRGKIDASVWLHVGFNLSTVIALVVTR